MMRMPINIIVGVKWVPNTTVVNVDPVTGTLIREGVPSIINPHDLNAVELSIELKEKYGGTITALAMGPPAAKTGLEFLVGMGVDKGVLVTDRVFAAADTFATSFVLAKAVERLSPTDLVIFGQETIDSSTSHIGAQVASWLNLPYVYYVTEAEVLEETHSLRVKRSLERQVDVYDISMPCVIVVMMKSNTPRHISMNRKLRAKLENPIEIWTNETLKLDASRTGLKGSPTVVSKSIPTPSVPRKKQTFDGREHPSEAAKWLIENLSKEGIE
jgi:electron transfer flavoprotein beta subunit